MIARGVISPLTQQSESDCNASPPPSSGVNQPLSESNQQQVNVLPQPQQHTGVYNRHSCASWVLSAPHSKSVNRSLSNVNQRQVNVLPQPQQHTGIYNRYSCASWALSAPHSKSVNRSLSNVNQHQASVLPQLQQYPSKTVVLAPETQVSDGTYEGVELSNGPQLSNDSGSSNNLHADVTHGPMGDDMQYTSDSYMEKGKYLARKESDDSICPIIDLYAAIPDKSISSSVRPAAPPATVPTDQSSDFDTLHSLLTPEDIYPSTIDLCAAIPDKSISSSVRPAAPPATVPTDQSSDFDYLHSLLLPEDTYPSTSDERVLNSLPAIEWYNTGSSNFNVDNFTNNSGIDAALATVLSNMNDNRSIANVNGNDGFTSFGQPNPHAIDHSLNGNQSVFDPLWENPPARINRDPRYQNVQY